MKRILIAALLFSSASVFAATDTRSIRTSTDLITYNDTVNSMFSKLGRPEGKHEHSSRDANGRLIFLTDYFYTINGLKYTITVLDGKIFRMQWER